MQLKGKFMLFIYRKYSVFSILMEQQSANVNICTLFIFSNQLESFTGFPFKTKWLDPSNIFCNITLSPENNNNNPHPKTN